MNKNIALGMMMGFALLTVGNSHAAGNDKIRITFGQGIVQSNEGNIYALLNTQFGGPNAHQATDLFPALVKLNRHGNIDTHFAKDGILALSHPSSWDSGSQLLLNGNQLGVFGTVFTDKGFEGSQWAYRFDGQPDPSFNGGQAKFNPSMANVRQVLPWKNNGIFASGVLAHSESVDLTFFRIGQQGDLIANFGQGGLVKVTSELDHWKTCAGPISDKMYCIFRPSGISSVRGEFAEFDAKGMIKTRALDFSATNAAEVRFYASAYDNQGKVYLAGKAQMGPAYESDIPIVARLNSTGEFDKSFGENGIVLLKNTPKFAFSIVARSSGGVYLGGSTAYSWDQGPKRIFAAALNEDGHLDGKFGKKGVTYASLRDQETGGIITAGDNGSLFLLGQSYYGPSHVEAVVTKIDNRGRIDRNFGHHGFRSIRP